MLEVAGWLGVYKPQGVYKSQHKSSLECIIGSNISHAEAAEDIDCGCVQGCWQPRAGVEKKWRLPNPGVLIMCQMSNLVPERNDVAFRFNM